MCITGLELVNEHTLNSREIFMQQIKVIQYCYVAVLSSNRLIQFLICSDLFLRITFSLTVMRDSVTALFIVVCDLILLKENINDYRYLCY